MLLSIITPYYKTLKEIKRLAKVLEPQLDDSIEWIIVDDGCNEKQLNKLKAKVIHLKENSGGASIPRNIGLDIARGKYIGFIDSDDLITPDYIDKIKNKLLKEPDILYLSWESKKHNIIIKIIPPKWNCSVWCRVIKKDIIGNVRFEPKLKIAEDYVFIKQLHPVISSSVKKPIYFYNIERKGSLTRR